MHRKKHVNLVLLFADLCGLHLAACTLARINICPSCHLNLSNSLNAQFILQSKWRIARLHWLATSPLLLHQFECKIIQRIGQLFHFPLEVNRFMCCAPCAHQKNVHCKMRRAQCSWMQNAVQCVFLLQCIYLRCSRHAVQKYPVKSV